MDKIEFNRLIAKYPDKKFCLHDGFAGFSFGRPSNPKWISFEEAYEILIKYEKLTKINPIIDIENTWYLFALEFENESKNLISETGYRMIGFVEEKDALYGNDGLG